MSIIPNRAVSFYDSFKKEEGKYSDWGLSEDEFEILKKKKIKVLMAAYECHNQIYCDEYVIFKIETPKLKNKFMIIYDRYSLDGILKYLVKSEINPENGKFQHQTDEDTYDKGCIIVKKGKGRIMKFIDCMFKRNIYNEVNSGEFQFLPPDTKTIKSNLNCSIFDAEFYNMLSKKFNVLRFDEDTYFAASNGVPNHHSLSKNVVWKKYCCQTLISNVERKWDTEKREWTGRKVNPGEFSRESLCGNPFTD